MAITKNAGRQWPLVAYVDVALADLTSGSAVAAIDIPPGADIISGVYDVKTAFDSGTSDAVVIQTNESTPTALVTDADAQAAVTTAFTIPAGGLRVPTTETGFTVDVKWTGAGTAATAGAIRLKVTYMVDGRANEVQPV